MQYTQRKLQRSVTEMRRSRSGRPRRSETWPWWALTGTKTASFKAAPLSDDYRCAQSRARCDYRKRDESSARKALLANQVFGSDFVEYGYAEAHNRHMS